MTQEDNTRLIEEIKSLKIRHNALVLAHNYQLAEIQEAADITGDSLALSRKAAETDNATVVFCGVRFMAETAALLCPGKTVLLPVREAGCRLSEMVDAETVRKLRSGHPGAPVVCYVNSTVEVKAESDVVCTSANAVDIVAALPEKRVIFVPDRNLGAYVAEKTGKELIIPGGFCPSHERISVDEIRRLKALFPDAAVMVHPECTHEVRALADAVESTGGMQRYAAQSAAKRFIVGTEVGMVYRLQADFPDKIFFAASEQGICPDMKFIRLVDLRDALLHTRYVISIDPEVRERALKAVERMLA